MHTSSVRRLADAVGLLPAFIQHWKELSILFIRDTPNSGRKVRLRWWMIHPNNGEKIVLWDYQGSQTGIPQNQTHYRMNFWHTNQWSVETNASSIEKPLHPYELEVDWMFYDPLKK